MKKQTANSLLVPDYTTEGQFCCVSYVHLALDARILCLPVHLVWHFLSLLSPRSSPLSDSSFLIKAKGFMFSSFSSASKSFLSSKVTKIIFS